MAKAYVLSEADRKLLKRLVQDYLAQTGERPTAPEENDDYRTSGAHIAYPDDADGIPAMDATGTADPTPGSGRCMIYQLSGAIPPTIAGVGFKETVYNISGTAIDQDYFLVHRLKTGKWVAGTAPGRAGTVGIFLVEDHPGRGVEFDVYVGTWNSDTHDWEYLGTATYPCIDWRFGVPYPTQGAQGLAEWRDSAAYGDILEVTSLDCEAPGTGTSA
jgi:hypothetical protein